MTAIANLWQDYAIDVKAKKTIYTQHIIFCSVFRFIKYSDIPEASPQLYGHALEVDDHKEIVSIRQDKRFGSAQTFA